MLHKSDYTNTPILPSLITPEQIASYRFTATQRDEARIQKLQKRRSQGMVVAQQAAQILKQWGATRVILFGSILTEYFHETSDIDLAVQDLPEHVYFRSIARLQDISDFAVDLVEIQNATPYIQAAITHGLELWKSTREKLGELPWKGSDKLISLVL